jgi:putative ABC transport system permease protein
MLRNYFKIAFRNLVKNPGYSVINIGGLALGISVAMLIGLWIYDEISFNKYHKNYDRIVQVMEQQTLDSETQTGQNVAIPVGKELETYYGDHFKHVVMSSWSTRHLLTVSFQAIKAALMDPVKSLRSE